MLCIGLVGIQPASAQPGDWQAVTGASGAPGERHENGFVQVGDKFILVGGRNSEWKLTEHYDFATNTWTQGSFHPMRMHHIQAVEIDGLVYIVGAMTGDFPNETPIGNVYVYDPLTTKWFQGAAIPAARQRGSMGAVVYNKKIYVIGGLTDGHNSGHVPYTDVYDPYTNTWTTLADAPRARDHFNAVLVGDQIYCIGGRRSKHNTTGLNSDMETLVDVYDILTDTWATLAAPLPTARAGASTAAIGNQVFIFGGESMTSGAHKETEVLDIVSKTWTTAWDTLTAPRHGTQAIVNNGVIYTAAGSRANAIEIVYLDTAFMEKFSPTGTFAAPTGTPYTPSTLTAAVSSYDFGNTITGTTASYVLTLTNSGGNEAILLSELNMSGTDSTDFDFGVAGNDPFQPIAIAPGGSIDVTLTFSPTEANAKSAIFTFTHSGSNGPQSITLTGTGCVGIPGGPNGAFIESGGSLMMQVESEIPQTGSDWMQGVDGATVYYEWTGSNFFVTPPADTIQYEFTINTPGIYHVVMRSQQFDFGSPTSGNDMWMQFPDADARKVKGSFPTPTENLPLTGWFKVYQADVTGWSWYTSAEEFNNVGIYLDIPVAGTYHMYIAGRSTGFKADKFAFYTYQQALSDSALDAMAESPRITTNCSKEWYEDADNDSFGNPAMIQIAASQPAGFVGNPDDCNDADAAINPNAVELNDNIDNNCNGQVDEGWQGVCQTIRINCGSDTAFTNSLGQVFQPDAYFSAATSTYGDGSLAIANTTADGMYQTTRSSNVDFGSFAYSIPVINGPYTVNLHFAEIFFGVGGNGGGVGTRVFDVQLEGVTELASFDILGDPQSGGNSATAVVKSFTVTVYDQNMDIFLTAAQGANRPKISAIELIPQQGCGSGTPFPIELLSFEALRQGEEVRLDWSTLTETNNALFSIERSADGVQFEEILSQSGAGTSQEIRHYSAVDTRPLYGLNYYRLKQTDIDGNFSYSNTILVNFFTDELRVYPNPVQAGKGLTLAFELAEKSVAEVSLTNMLGQRVAFERVSLEAAAHEHSLQLGDLAPGYYLLKVKLGYRTLIQKIAITE